MAKTDAKSTRAPWTGHLVVVHPFFYPGTGVAYKHGDEITDASVVADLTAEGSHLERNCVRVPRQADPANTKGATA